MFLASNTGVSCLVNISSVLCAGSDSPVRVDSSIFKFLATMILESAGILSPSRNRIISPATTLVSGMIISFSSRRTTALVSTNSFKARRVFLARPSWIEPAIALKISTAIIIKASTVSPIISTARLATKRM